MAARLARRGMAGPAGRGMGDVPPANGSAANLQDKFQRGILAGFQPGNIGDINSVIWPFFFQFSASDVNPNQSVIQSFSVTQEAGFLIRQISQSSFLKTGPNYSYIDPFLADESLNSANGLVFGLQDAQSTRQYNGRALEDISMLGSANFPTIYPSTVFLLPNQTMQLTLANNDPVNVYRTFVTVFGYRVRVANAQQMLSTVSG